MRTSRCVFRWTRGWVLLTSSFVKSVDKPWPENDKEMNKHCLDERKECLLVLPATNRVSTLGLKPAGCKKDYLLDGVVDFRKA